MNAHEYWLNEYYENTPPMVDEPLTKAEAMTVLFLSSFAGILLIIAAWSGILLATGAIDNGGPLGFIMAQLPFPGQATDLHQPVADVYKVIDV